MLAERKEFMIKKASGFLTEFRDFAVKGNAINLAIAVVVGGAFSGIVNSLVGDIITPLLGLITGNVDFKTLAWTVNPNLIVKYGAFLQAIFNFLVISFSIFLMFKLVTTAHSKLFKPGEAAPEPAKKPREEELLEEIRDLLRERNEKTQ